MQPLRGIGRLLRSAGILIVDVQWRRSALAFLTVVAAISIGRAEAQNTALPSPVGTGSPDIGRALFQGQIRFKNGGPPCGACHRFAGLPFPNGGSMGPDLTNEYSRLGPDGLSAALETLYFPTMVPLFASHPLTADEQTDLAAFIKTGTRQRGEMPVAAGLGVTAIIGLLILAAITWIAGRRRVRSVRGALLRRAGLPTGAR